MACVVHYDLLGWLPIYPYGRRAAVHEARDRGPDAALNFDDGPWIPRPGTDPYVASYPRPTVLVRDYGDIDYDEDDFWTEVTDADESCDAVGNGDGTGTCAASGGGAVGDRTVTRDVRAAPDDDGGDADHDDGDYAAAGEERDDDVF